MEFKIENYQKALAAVAMKSPIDMIDGLAYWFAKHPLTDDNKLFAEALPLKDGRKTCVYNIDVTDELGTKVAFVQVTGFKKV